MAHTSLYRKYRPSTFDDVVGQQHIERTIRNAVGEGTVAHAYLFSGPRGTGKTTTARLLAKALLCERGPTPEPDATCEQCIDVAEGRHPDVYELDAASRTGVDNVREEIIGRVSFAPTRGRYKVYIIDEVHMLSTAAFNALLKTLEEPPPHVIFVMCTTHPHKVPETIQSRCQRFDFRRLSVEDIADRLRYIAEAEGFHIERGALSLLARHAEGGMRDAITALEQLASFTGGEITADDVEGILGEIDSAQLFELTALVARRDIAGCFRWVASLVETGTELAELVRALTGHVRDLYVIAAVGDSSGVVDRPADEISRLQAQAAEFGGPDRLSRVLDLLGELSAELRWSSDPRLSLEVALTRMARPQGEMTLEALAERVELLERMEPVRQIVETAAQLPPAASMPAAATPAAAATASRADTSVASTSESASVPVAPATTAPASAASDAPPAAAAKTPEAPTPAAAPARETSAPVSRREGALDRGAVKRDWQAVLMEIKKIKPGRVQTFSSVEVDIDEDGRTIVVEFPADQEFSKQLAENPDTRELLKKALAAVFGTAPPFRYQLGRGAVRPPEDPPAAKCEPASSKAAPGESASKPTYDEPTYSDPRYDEPTAGLPPQEPTGGSEAPAAGTQEQAIASSDADAGVDIEHLLIHGLGATIVDERPRQTTEEEPQS